MCKTEEIKVVAQTTVHKENREQPGAAISMMERMQHWKSTHAKPKVRRPIVKIQGVTRLIPQDEEERRRRGTRTKNEYGKQRRRDERNPVRQSTNSQNVCLTCYSSGRYQPPTRSMLGPIAFHLRCLELLELI